MKFLPLIWAGLRRHPLRASLTFLSILCAFFLFGILQGRLATFNDTGKRQHVDLLVTISRHGPPMPVSYQEQIRQVPGVATVVRASTLPAWYQEPRNALFVLAAESTPEVFALFPERIVSPEVVKTWTKLRTGAIVAGDLARQHGWTVGQTISLQSSLPQKNGRRNWEVELVGTFEASKRSDANVVFMHFDYFDEARAFGQGTAAQFVASLTDPREAGKVANTIDSMFLRSSIATRTLTEKELAESLLTQFGDLTFFVSSITAAVLFTLALLTANTMYHSISRRLPEIAMMKTLGFSDAKLLTMMVSEALVLLVTAAAVGLAAALITSNIMSPDAIELSSVPRVVALALVLALVIAAVSCALPAYRLRFVKIVDVLAGR